MDPGGKLAAHTVPQSMPAGLEVTRSLPEPANATLNVHESTNWAVTDLAASMTMVQLAKPLHAPPQPLNALPPAADAVRVTVVRAGKVALQAVDGQLSPDGLDVTLP